MSTRQRRHSRASPGSTNGQHSPARRIQANQRGDAQARQPAAPNYQRDPKGLGAGRSLTKPEIKQVRNKVRETTGVLPTTEDKPSLLSTGLSTLSTVREDAVTISESPDED